MPRKKTTEEFIAEAIKVHGDKYDYSLVDYVNTMTKIKIICPIHGSFMQTPTSHLQGKGCYECFGNKQLSTNEFIARARQVHGDKYDYSQTKYINSRTKLSIICPIHGFFEQKPHQHLDGRGCPKCASTTLSTENFILTARKKHGEKYNYSKVNYKNSKTKVCIICPIHGDFWQTPQKHIQGQGCPSCSGRAAQNTEKFIQKARQIHGNKYDYCKVIYKKAKLNVCIICPIHGEFWQSPNKHLNGHGCPLCGGSNKKTKEDFIINARRVHGDKYDYSKVEYINANVEVLIICPEHGPFLQTPSAHINGSHGCPNCNKGFTRLYKINVLNKSDISSLTTHQLIELIAMRKLPLDFLSLAYSSAYSKERKDSIELLKHIYNTSQEDDVSALLSDELHNKEMDLKRVVINSDNKDNNYIELISDEKKNEFIIHSTEFYDSPLINISGEGEKFIIGESLNGLWNQALRNENTFIEMYKEHKSSGKWFDTIRDEFFKEYDAVNAITPTKDYVFPYKPNLMQRLMVYRILSNDYYGNWCGTGAGKTLARDMASRAIKAKVSLYIVPNSVIDTTVNALREEYGDSSHICIVSHLTDSINCVNHKPNYIIVNYEKFQQENTGFFIDSLLSSYTIDFICMDEVQNVKVRNTDDISLRNRRISKLILEARKRNPSVKVVALSATPIINNLTEVRMLMELLTGKRYDDIGSTVSLVNIHAAYKALLINGFRYIPKYDIKINELVLPIDGTPLIDALLQKKAKDILGIEQLLAEAKMEAVVANGKLKKGTLIFTEFVDGIVPMIQQWVEACGFSVACYTGNENAKERDRVINSFITGHTDILIGSMPITTGVDGLQKCCNRMIIISAPWTNSEYVQLVGRIYRQGSNYAEVDIIRPEVNISITDGTWSWDKRRFSIIETKKTLGEAVMDGDFQKVYNGEGLRKKLMAQAMEALRDGLENGHYFRKEIEVIQDKKQENQLSELQSKEKAFRQLVSNVHDEFDLATKNLSEIQIEEMLDSDTGYAEIEAMKKIRLLNRSIGETLKQIYDYRCQVTGEKLGNDYGVNAVEIHHIIPFSESLNNDSSNLIVLSPDFHRIVHRANAKFDRKGMCFVFPNGKIVPIKLNYHL